MATTKAAAHEATPQLRRAAEDLFGSEIEALVATPLMRAMEEGRIVRFEELTRMGSDVQDTLITVLSEKILPIPELNSAVHAQRGFNVIATANNRDKGVN